MVDNDSNSSPPTFEILGTATGPGTVLPPPTTPFKLQFVCWPEAFDTAYDYAIVPARDIATEASPCNNIGGDSANAYYFGSSPISIDGGESVTVSAALSLAAPSSIAPAMNVWGIAIAAASLLAAVSYVARSRRTEGS